MAEYIERGKAREFLYRLAAEADPVQHMYHKEFVDGYKAGLELAAECRIDDIPVEDVRPERHGKWLLEREPDGTPYCFHCSVCDDGFRHISITTAYAYCPFCGAKMDGEEFKNG